MKTGSRLKSAVCGVEVIVIRAKAAQTTLNCGGQPMVDGTGASRDPRINPAFADGTELGKRYVDDEAGIEVLCTKAGEGTLSVGDRPLTLKAAKALPSSD